MVGLPRAFILSLTALLGAPAQAASEAEARERIEIIGSKLPASERSAMWQPRVLGATEIAQSRSSDLAQLLNEAVPGFAFGNPRPQVSSGVSNQEGVSYAALRGLSRHHTLVLLDGFRLTPNGGSGTLDLSRIPLAAIERIEILGEGAAPIYGSEAAAGVINIVTKREREGWAGGWRVQRPEQSGGEQSLGGVSYGFNQEAWSGFTSLSYSRAAALFDSQRSWSEEGWSSNSFPANYADAVDRTPSGAYRWHDYRQNPESCFGRVNEAGLCEFNYAPFLQYYPEQENLSLLQKLRYTFNTESSLSLWLLAGQQTSSHILPPLATSTETLPAAAAATLGLPADEWQPGHPLVYRYRAAALGPRHYEARARNYDLRLQYSYEPAASWGWQLSLSQGEDAVRLRADGFLLRSAFNELVQSGAFNPLSSAGGDILRTAAYASWETFEARMQELELRTSSPSYTFLGAEHRLALGLVLGLSRYRAKADPLALIQGDPSTGTSEALIGFTAGAGAGSRRSRALFVEAQSDWNGSTVLSLAGRAEAEAGFNQRLLLSQRLGSYWLVSASTATGFRAPDLRSLYQGIERKSPFAIDALRCQQNLSPTLSCRPMQYRGYLEGNPDLKVEEARTYAAQLQLIPHGAWPLQASLSSWAIDIKNAILDETDWNAYLEAEAAGIDLGRYGITIDRGTTSQGEIRSISVRRQNTAAQKVRGFDLDLGSSLAFSGGWRFSWSSQYSELTRFAEEPIPGLGLRERLGSSEKPRWRNHNRFGLSYASHTLSLFNENIAGHKKWDQVSRRGEKLGAFTSWDLQYRQEFLRGWTLAAGVINLFDREPPIDESKEGHNRVSQRLYSALGRQYLLELSRSEI